ncbi:hypothetical protein [Paraglaciecola sp.]|uniref:hypothetical protein n=1 Tax=Paraglaciecola sp. TaxID=1920173 RepID=UPI003EF6F69C
MICFLKSILTSATLITLTACGGGGASQTPAPTSNTSNQATNSPQVTTPAENSPTIVKGYEIFEPLLTSDTFNIYAITNCGDIPSSNSSNIVLLDGNTPIDGDAWSHVDGSQPWIGLSKPANSYDIQRQANIQDTDCNNVSTYNSILVKKYGDWDQQHANGYFANNEQDINFDKLDTVIMDIYYDSTLSTLPTTVDISEAYQSLTNDQLAEWDDGLFHLKVQLSDTTGNYHGAFNLRLTTDMADKWLRVEVPVSELTIWRTEGYTKFDITQSDIANKTLKRIGLVAETKNLKVFRNYNPEGFNIDTTPKLFKEIAFRVKRLEITTKQN